MPITRDCLSGRENLRTLKVYGQPLGVTCGACGRRSLVDLAVLGAHDGNMQPLMSLRLVCRACGSRDWRPAIFVTPLEAEALPPWDWGARKRQ